MSREHQRLESFADLKSEIDLWLCQGNADVLYSFARRIVAFSPRYIPSVLSYLARLRASYIVAGRERAVYQVEYMARILRGQD